MSRKKESTQITSLASCLYFAARLLCSSATVQEICTKSVLAPMVVEAHKCGQEVKRLEVSTPIDIRELLMKLQHEHDSKSCRQSPLVDLDVADLTWDFEGTVADTLSMEIEELQDRAAMSALNICVVLSVSSELSAGGHAVIWFPMESLCNVSSKKNRQILLYVCPGRVKVVKSASDLLKKMYEELPVLRENGATYNVWAVVMGSKSRKQQKEECGINQLSITQEHIKNQEICESILTSAEISNDLSLKKKKPCSLHDTDRSDSSIVSTKMRTSIDSSNKQDLIGASFRPNNDTAAYISSPRDDDTNDPLSQPLHFVAHPEATRSKANLTQSIFSFSTQQRISTVPQRISSERANNCLHGAVGATRDKGFVDLEVEAADLSSSDDEDAFENNQYRNLRSRRTCVSSSLTKFDISTKDNYFEEDTMLNLKANGLTWQSCDGQVVRNAAQLQRQIGDFDVNLIKRKSLAVTVSRNNRDEQGAFVEDHRDLSNQAEEDDDQKNQSIDDDSSRVEPIVEKTLQYDQVQKLQHEHCVCLPHQTMVISPHFGSVSGASHVKDAIETEADISRPSDEKSNIDDEVVEHVDGGLKNETNNVYVANKSESSVVNSEEDIVSVARMAEVDSAKRSQSSLQQEDTLLPQKLRPRLNYRDKLGPRIWWELEYTARRLEREEILERKQQQQARQKQDHDRHETHLTTCHPGRTTQNMLQHCESGISHKEVLLPDNICICQQKPSNSESNEPFQVSRKQASIDEEQSPLVESENGTNANVSSSDRVSKLQPDMTVSLSKSQTGIAGLRPFEECKQTKVFSSFQPGDEDYVVPASILLESHEPEELSFNCTTRTVSPAMLPSFSSQPNVFNLIESYEQRQSSDPPFSKSTVNEFVKRSSVPPQVTVKSASLKASLDAENEEKAPAQMTWASTDKCYDEDRNASSHATVKDDDPLTSESPSAIPFTICGRVPIRSQINPVPDDLLSTEQSLTSNGSHHTGDGSKLLTQARPYLRRDSTAPLSAPVATFVAVENSATMSVNTRELRLNELRQKKLLKLQQARDIALQQQKEKQQLRRPLSFANSFYTKKASNRQLVQNALEFTLLAGGSMENGRMLALQALAESTCDNFIVLLKSAKELTFRGLYENHVDRDSATRIFSLLPSTSSRAPLKIDNSGLISQFFRYSSAKKQFLPVPTRSFTVKTDACALVDPLIFKGKSGIALTRLL